MNRRELYRQMRAAELCPLPPRIEDVGFLGLWWRLVRSFCGLAVRVGLAFGLVVGTLAVIGTALLDRQLWAAPGQSVATWLVVCAVLAVLTVAASLVGAVLLLVWMLARRQLRHRRYTAALLGGMLGGASAVAVALFVWRRWIVGAGGMATASVGGWLVLLGVTAIGLWVGRALQVVLGVWWSHGLASPLAPRYRRRSALWRGALLAGLLGVAAVALDGQRVPAFARGDDRVAETLSFSRDRHVVLLGIDGLGWDAVRHGIEDGSLKNWDTLERNGGRGRLYSPAAHGPAAFWITVATGVTDRRHGVRSLLQPEVLGARRPMALGGEHVALRYVYGELLRALGLSRQVPVSRESVRRWLGWEIVRQAGGEAGVIGWWGAWPNAGEAGTLNMPALMRDTDPGAAPLDTDARVGDAMRAILHRSPRPSLTMAYFPGLDLLARASDGRSGEEQALAHRRFLDALIGEVAASLGPDDLLLVIGDPGARRADGRPAGGRREEDGGVMLAFGSGIEPATRLARPRAVDVWPTVAWWLGLPPARDWDGHVWTNLRPAWPLLPAIDTYGGPARDATLDPAAVALRRRQLRDAGYLTGPD